MPNSIRQSPVGGDAKILSGSADKIKFCDNLFFYLKLFFIFLNCIDTSILKIKNIVMIYFLIKKIF